MSSAILPWICAFLQRVSHALAFWALLATAPAAAQDPRNGDEGPGIEARLNRPYGVAVAADGSVQNLAGLPDNSGDARRRWGTLKAENDCPVRIRTRDGGVLFPGRGKEKDAFFLPRRDLHSKLPSPLCEGHAFSGGWREPMRLFLGGEAQEFLPLVTEAVAAWNRVFSIPIIELQEDGPVYQVGPDFWSDDGDVYYGDGVSVLYVTKEPSNRGRGFGHPWISTNDEGLSSIVEADIFIYSRYFPSDSLGLYSTIMHELGHALGLAHITVSGNMMSYDRMDSVRDILDPFVALGILGDDFPLKADSSDSDWERFIWGSWSSESLDNGYLPLIRRLLRPQEQDKTILMCIYEFSDWGR